MRNRRIFSLIVYFETSRQFEKLGIWLGGRQLGNRECLLAEKWTSANGQQVYSELSRVPGFAHADQRLVIPHSPSICGSRFSNADSIDSRDVSRSQILPHHISITIRERTRRTPARRHGRKSVSWVVDQQIT